MPNTDWVFLVGADEKPTHVHCPYVQFCLQQIKSTQPPCTNKELAKVYKAAFASLFGGTDTLSNFVLKTS